MMLLPLYVHPLEDPAAWESLRRNGERVTAIVNVHDGPGEDRDDTYVKATEQLADAGVKMLGYVDLDYTRRPAGDVLRDIAGWAPYPVGGIFFDRAPSDEAGFPYVGRVVRAVHGSVVLNPGTRCLPGYGTLADAVCTFEGPWSSYVDSAAYAGRDWPNAAHLVYGVPRDQLASASALLLSRAPHGLATDLDMPLPYLGLPAFLRHRSAVGS
jgi:hypothetical protein